MSSSPWSSPACSSAAFVLWQSKGPNPLLPLRVVRNRNRAGSFPTILLAVTGMFGTFLFLTYLLQTIDHYSPLKTGVAFLPLMAMNALAATQVASRLMPHVRTRLLVVPGLLLAALGVALFTQLTPDASYWTSVLPSELLLGFGLGLAIVPCISTATQNADPKDVGVTSATTNTSQQIGASIGTALLNTIAAAATATYLASHHVRRQHRWWPTPRCTATPWPVGGRPGSSCWRRSSPACSSTCTRGSAWSRMSTWRTSCPCRPSTESGERGGEQASKRASEQARKFSRPRLRRTARTQPRAKSAGSSASVITAPRRGKILSSKKVCTSGSVSAHPSASTSTR